MPAVAWYGMQFALIRCEGPGSSLSRAIGRDLKGKISPVPYAVGIVAAFFDARLATALYALVAVLWLIPDRRVERAFPHGR